MTVIDGTTLYVTDSSGNVVKVTTNTGTTVSKTDTGTVSELAPGESVVIRGVQSSAGVYAAQSVSEGAAAAFGGGSVASAAAPDVAPQQQLQAHRRRRGVTDGRPSGLTTVLAITAGTACVAVLLAACGGSTKAASAPSTTPAASPAVSAVTECCAQ